MVGSATSSVVMAGCLAHQFKVVSVVETHEIVNEAVAHSRICKGAV